jgi:hypothetical protein
MQNDVVGFDVLGFVKHFSTTLRFNDSDETFRRHAGV